MLYSDVIIKKGKNKFWLIYLSWQDSAPTEVGKIFSNLIRNRMDCIQIKALRQRKIKAKTNAPALLSNSKFLKAFFN